jgi:hypothetical protein
MDIITTINEKLNEILYDPHAILHKLDADIQDLETPCIDVAIRRKLYLKGKQVSRLFLYIDDCYHENRIDMRCYPSKTLIETLEKLSNLYMFQIEPEILDHRIKLEPRNEEEYELHQRKHNMRYSMNAIDYKYIYGMTFNPVFDSSTSYYDHFWNPRQHIMVEDIDNYPENAFPRPEMPCVRSSLYSQILFMHSTMSVIHENTLLPLVYALKSAQRKVHEVICYDIPIFKRVPDIIIETILNDYL